MSDFSTYDFLKSRQYWTLLSSSTIFNNAVPFTYHISGDLFRSVTSKGVIRIKDEDSILILEYDTFNSITSSLEGGCVYFSPGHSFYHKDICAQYVYSTTKVHYGAIGISQTSENINYNSMISIIDCTAKSSISDMFSIVGGKTTISNYNSTNNIVIATPGFYFGNSYGKAIASFINILSGTATNQAIIYSDSDCTIKYSNFYKNTINGPNHCLFILIKATSSIDNCVFAYNNAPKFINQQVSITYCSFYENSINTAPPSIKYVGSHSFIVNTQCHMWNHNDCIKKYSCVCRYFTISSYMFSVSIFILFI